MYKLWEGSWEDGAVVRDRDAGIFTHPEKVHKVRHDGKYFHVDAVHLCEPSPQRTPVLYQAGASTKGVPLPRHTRNASSLPHQPSACSPRASPIYAKERARQAVPPRIC